MCRDFVLPKKKLKSENIGECHNRPENCRSGFKKKLLLKKLHEWGHSFYLLFNRRVCTNTDYKSPWRPVTASASQLRSLSLYVFLIVLECSSPAAESPSLRAGRHPSRHALRSEIWTSQQQHPPVSDGWAEQERGVWATPQGNDVIIESCGKKLHRSDTNSCKEHKWV